jgi:hypothetical protein
MGAEAVAGAAEGVAGRRPPHFSGAHPLAEVAGRRCEGHLGRRRRLTAGQVACGACWERAVRDDERFAVEFGLPREVSVEAGYVDEIAVSLACAGQRVPLTPAERVEAVRRLRDAGLRPGEIAGRLGMSGGNAQRALAALRQEAAKALNAADARGGAADASGEPAGPISLPSRKGHLDP